MPPEENIQASLPEEVLKTQELEQAVMPEGVQLPLNLEEQSEYALPSENTHPITGKGKAALQSALGGISLHRKIPPPIQCSMATCTRMTDSGLIQIHQKYQYYLIRVVQPALEGCRL
jgi:hypothetical protein